MAKTYNINCNNNKNNYLIKKFINKTGKKHPNNKCRQLIHLIGVSTLKEERIFILFLLLKKNNQKRKKLRKEFIMQIGSEQQPSYWLFLSIASSTLSMLVDLNQMMCLKSNRKKMESLNA